MFRPNTRKRQLLSAILALFLRLTAGLENVARKGTASQYNTYNGWTANRAIDGNTDGDTGHGSVIHTGGGHTWWMVNLKGKFTIKKIVIWNRTNGYTERLTNAVLKILACDFETVLYEKKIGASSGFPQFEFDMDISGGSYVRIEQTSYLNFAEVEVYGVPEQDYDDPMEYALQKLDNSWKVDLKHAFNIKKISITNKSLCIGNTDDIVGANVKFLADNGSTILGTHTFTDKNNLVRDMNVQGVSVVSLEVPSVNAHMLVTIKQEPAGSSISLQLDLYLTEK